MSDLVERLRAGSPCAACWGNADGTCKVKDVRSGCECAEAAARIEQLEAALKGSIAMLEQLGYTPISKVARAALEEGK